jgi:hypothetical protein
VYRSHRNDFADLMYCRFQWASLQIEQLLELDLEVDIRARLGKLPDGLETAYDEILEQISRKPGSQATIAHRAFQWIMCSKEAIDCDTLIAAVCQDPDNDSIVAPFVDLGFVLKACNNLLVVDLEGICHFSHLSVQEYLEEKVWTASQANSYVARVCLVALNDDKLDHEQAQFAQFIPYVNKYWHHHVRGHNEYENDARLSTLLKEFFGAMDKSGPAYRRWYKNNQDISNFDDYVYNFDEIAPPSSASFAICLFGIFGLLSSWWEIGFADVEQKNDRGSTLLQVAAIGGSILATQVLVEFGTDVNAQGGKYGNALQAASYEGHITIVELLLGKGADVNAQGGVYGNALEAAMDWGDNTNVQLLLSRGAIEHQPSP